VYSSKLNPYAISSYNTVYRNNPQHNSRSEAAIGTDEQASVGVMQQYQRQLQFYKLTVHVPKLFSFDLHSRGCCVQEHET
jgi:hypothetical protein